MSTSATFPLTLDTYIDATDPTTSFGATDELIKIGSWPLGNGYNGLMRADLSSIPEDAEIREASMAITAGSVGGAAVVYRLTQTGWTASATWNKYDGTNNWSTAGGDYDPTQAFVFSFPNTEQAVTIESDRFLEFIQNTVRVYAGALEMILVNPVVANGVIYGFDNATTSKRPLITVVYDSETSRVGSGELAEPEDADQLIETDPFPLNPQQKILKNRAFE